MIVRHTRGQISLQLPPRRAHTIRLKLHPDEQALYDGISALVLYHGSLSPAHKDAAIRDFQGDLLVLLSTEAAGEGRNLQFCRVMVNFDLPWNPMRIEQRIGRIHCPTCAVGESGQTQHRGF